MAGLMAGDGLGLVCPRYHVSVEPPGQTGEVASEACDAGSVWIVQPGTEWCLHTRTGLTITCFHHVFRRLDVLCPSRGRAQNPSGRVWCRQGDRGRIQRHAVRARLGTSQDQFQRVASQPSLPGPTRRNRLILKVGHAGRGDPLGLPRLWGDVEAPRHLHHRRVACIPCQVLLSD